MKQDLMLKLYQCDNQSINQKLGEYRVTIVYMWLLGLSQYTVTIEKVTDIVRNYTRPPLCTSWHYGELH